MKPGLFSLAGFLNHRKIGRSSEIEFAFQIEAGLTDASVRISPASNNLIIIRSKPGQIILVSRVSKEQLCYTRSRVYDNACIYKRRFHRESLLAEFLNQNKNRANNKPGFEKFNRSETYSSPRPFMRYEYSGKMAAAPNRPAFS